jgi:hypothetical protein
VLSGDLKLADDASPGDWIAPLLQGDFGAVSLTVPSGYPAYARICHPATDTEDAPVSWPEVAKFTGRTAHALMQWHALVGSPDWLNVKGSLWPGGDPERGNLAPGPLEALCELLGEHTTDAAHCFFGLWVGWAWVESGSDRMTLRRTGVGDAWTTSTERIPPAFTGQELSRPRLRLPDRDYLLLTGPLSAATQVGDPNGVDGFDPQSPNLFWPADHAWCVASEIDFDSTLVGGSTGLIQTILDTPALDAWPVKPEDSLACDADRVNDVPDWSGP